MSHLWCIFILSLKKPTMPVDSSDKEFKLHDLAQHQFVQPTETCPNARRAKRMRSEVDALDQSHTHFAEELHLKPVIQILHQPHLIYVFTPNLSTRRLCKNRWKKCWQKPMWIQFSSICIACCVAHSFIVWPWHRKLKLCELKTYCLSL